MNNAPQLFIDWLNSQKPAVILAAHADAKCSELGLNPHCAELHDSIMKSGYYFVGGITEAWVRAGEETQS